MNYQLLGKKQNLGLHLLYMDQYFDFCMKPVIDLEQLYLLIHNNEFEEFF